METSRATAAMRLSLELARRGARGSNPLVGAVIIDSAGTILGTGHHRGAGTAHAEADALNRLGALDPKTARDATMVVNLEPCNHTGRTGPCTGAIIDSGIGNVIFASDDGGTKSGGGAQTLRAAGINVSSGLLRSEATELNHRWFAARNQGRPFTTLHLAQTLDGRIAAKDGSSQWITSTASLLHAHQVRARVGAIVVGTGTVMADDPRLSARNEHGEPLGHQPRRVVMGLREIPADAALKADGNYEQVRTRDPHEVLVLIASRGIGHVLLEGGASIATAFLAADLVDEIFLYQAPIFLGAGRSSIGEMGIETLAEARTFRLDLLDGEAVRILGPDTLTHLEPAPAGTGRT